MLPSIHANAKPAFKNLFMTTQPSLDPRINPWKRGDVCTRHFDDVGFVVNCTKECIEVRWLERGAMGAVEKISADEMNNLRVGHADGPSLDGRGRTNLEALLSLEALDVIQSALANRAFKNDREKHEADEFVRRAFHGCA